MLPRAVAIRNGCFAVVARGVSPPCAHWDVCYKTGDECAAWARATYTAERGLIARLGLPDK
jgi:predicted transglutaminase-like cysteine proteinase